jgi:hypothetical protein
MANYEIVTQDTDVQQLFQLLQNDQAFDKTLVTVAGTAGQSMDGLKGHLDFVTAALPDGNLEDVTSASTMIGDTRVSVDDLGDHLTWHFDNLITNLGVATSYIGDSIGFGGAIGASPGGSSTLMSSASRSVLRAATSTASPCDPMQSFFGSLMGKAGNILGSALGGLNGVMGQVSNMLGGGILSAIQKAGVLPNLSSIPGIGNIGSLLNNLTGAGATGNIGALLSKIGTMASGSQLGSVFSQIGSLTNMANLGGLMGNISSLGTSLGSVLGGATGISTSQISSFMTQFKGLSGQLTSLMGAIGSGNIGSLVGSLGSALQGQLGSAIKSAMGSASGALGQISSLISGEKNALNAAVKQLVAMAGAINLPRLWANTCGAGVLNAAGSDSLKSTLNGSGSSGGGDTGGGGSDSSGSDAVQRPTEYPQDTVYTPNMFSNANVSSGVAPQTWNDLYPVVPTSPAPTIGSFSGSATGPIDLSGTESFSGSATGPIPGIPAPTSQTLNLSPPSGPTVRAK